MITELPLNPSADELEVSEPMEEAVVANEPEAAADSDVWVEVRIWLLTDVRGDSHSPPQMRLSDP